MWEISARWKYVSDWKEEGNGGEGGRATVEEIFKVKDNKKKSFREWANDTVKQENKNHIWDKMSL